MASSKAMNIYKVLRARISNLEYEPGMVLRENDIAEEFGVSRTIVRRALHELNFEGLIESKKRLGTVVTGFDIKTTKEIYDIRLHLIDLVASESNVPFSGDDVAMMKALIPRITAIKEVKDEEEYWAINNDLFNILMRVVQNGSLCSLMRMLFFQTARNWAFLLPKIWQDACDLLIQEVELVVALMRARDRRGVFLARKSFILRSISQCEEILRGLPDDYKKHFAHFEFGFSGIKAGGDPLLSPEKKKTQGGEDHKFDDKS